MGNLDGKASLFQYHFLLQALLLHGACHNPPPGAGLQSPAPPAAQWLPGTRLTHYDTSRRQACTQYSLGAHDGPDGVESSRKWKTTPWTGPSSFALCWRSPHGLSLIQEQSFTFQEWVEHKAGGARPGVLAWAVTLLAAGVLSAGVLLCVKGGQGIKKGKAAGG